jgi:hypothetical protein
VAVVGSYCGRGGWDRCRRGGLKTNVRMGIELDGHHSTVSKGGRSATDWTGSDSRYLECSGSDSRAVGQERREK